MKQSKVLAIASKSYNSVIKNFKYSKIFFWEILTLSFLFVIIVSFLFDITFQQLLFMSVIVVIFDLLILYTSGHKRKREVEVVKSVIKSIHKNQITNVEKIKLSSSLSDLEGDKKLCIKGLKQILQEWKNLQKLALIF
ncbi:MAG: hypothetical protein GY936_01760 [Ignavibacteriae bacterium]|nr:hypothetical protein [Ignavibacteriota bacterium]